MLGKGGMPGSSTFKDCKTLETIVKKQAAEARPYAAICAAPAVALGSWGLLKGLKVRTDIRPVYFSFMYLQGFISKDYVANEVLMMWCC